MRGGAAAAAILLLVCSGSPVSAQELRRLSDPGTSPGVWGMLAVPAGRLPHPGVIIVPGSAGWDARYPPLVRALADSGYAVLGIDYHAETGRDTSGEDAVLKRPIWLATIRNAVALLRASASADRPVALVGFSRGAFLAVAVAASTPGVGAVVDFFGGGAADPDSLRAQVRGLPPLLILHGDADSTVAVAQAYRLRDAVIAEGGEVEVHIYPGAGHGFTAPDSTLPAALRVMADFLERRLRAGQREAHDADGARRPWPLLRPPGP